MCEKNLGIFRYCSSTLRVEKPKPDVNVGFFIGKKYYCRGSTLSNTRFANNELSSINC